MHLFRIEKENFLPSDYIIIQGSDYKHLTRALRRKEKDRFFASEGISIYECIIEKINKDSAVGKIISSKKIKDQGAIKFILFAGLIKFSNFELLLDYAVQTGVAEIYPLLTEYTQNINIAQAKAARWQKIINESAKQSFNPVPPVLKNPISFSEAVNFDGFKILLHPYTETKLKDILKDNFSDTIGLYIGPEAGFSDQEIQLAVENKINIARCPYNILKSETMALSLISNILFYFR